MACGECERLQRENAELKKQIEAINNVLKYIADLMQKGESAEDREAKLKFLSSLFQEEAERRKK